MRQTKRKFVALSTALAMALVLVASLVPTTVAQALSGGPTYIINEVAFDFTSPKAGDSVSLGGEDGNEPSMTTAISTSTVGMKHDESDTPPIPGGFFVKDSINSVEDFQEVDLEDSLFVGTFESGKTYKAVVGGEADIDNGYALADDVNVTVNGGATIVNKKIENTVSGHNGVLILISFTVGGGESGGGDIPASVPVKDGYSDQTVSSSAAASTAANGTSGTATSDTSSTTKVKSPKTADALPIAGIALVFVGATLIAAVAIRRKN